MHKAEVHLCMAAMELDPVFMAHSTEDRTGPGHPSIARSSYCLAKLVRCLRPSRLAIGHEEIELHRQLESRCQRLRKRPPLHQSTKDAQRPGRARRETVDGELDQLCHVLHDLRRRPVAGRAYGISVHRLDIGENVLEMCETKIPSFLNFLSVDHGAPRNSQQRITLPDRTPVHPDTT